MALTGKKKRFFEEYIIDRNGARAAIAAGYSEAYAKQRAYALLHNDEDVRAAVDEWERRQHEEKTAERNEVIEFLTEVMRGESEVENIPIFVGDGEQRFRKGLPSAKDRLKAAELLGKCYAMFTDKAQIDGAVPVQIIDNIPECEPPEITGFVKGDENDEA